jgi:hypothetical protein
VVDFNHCIAQASQFRNLATAPQYRFCRNRRARNVETPQAELAKRSEFNKKEQVLAIEIRSIIARIT